MNEIEKKRKFAELKRVEAARISIEVQLMELEENKERLKLALEVQLKAEENLKTQIGV